MRVTRHAAYCRCPKCGPVDKWAVYDGDKVFTVENLSQAEIDRRKHGKQLKQDRYWLKWDDVPVEAREAFLNLGQGQRLEAFIEPFSCPFCGSVAILNCLPAKVQLLHYVICCNVECACSLKPSFSPIQAVTKWNRRVIQLRGVRAAAEAKA